MPSTPIESFRFDYGRLFDSDIRIEAGILIKPTIITWQRLEPTPLTLDLAPSLQAQIADPLWMLTRQWQFVEFLGEDAGSPVAVWLEGENAVLSRYCPGATTAQTPDANLAVVDYRHLEIPLEVIVECEAVRATHPRIAAEAGEHPVR